MGQRGSAALGRGIGPVRNGGRKKNKMRWSVG